MVESTVTNICENILTTILFEKTIKANRRVQTGSVNNVIGTMKENMLHRKISMTTVTNRGWGGREEMRVRKVGVANSETSDSDIIFTDDTV